MNTFITMLTNELSVFSPKVKIADSGSAYIKLSGCKINQIRVANHPGRKTSCKCWELRSDAVTGRYKTGRVYGVNSIKQLIKDLL